MPVKKPAKKTTAKKTATKKAAVKKVVAKKAAVKKPAKKTALKKADGIASQLALVLSTLEDGKAEDVMTFDLRDRSSLADHLVIASGRSTRQVAALAENVSKALKKAGHKIFHREGEGNNDWVVVDTGDVIVHLFRPEVRSYYRLEELWQKPKRS